MTNACRTLQVNCVQGIEANRKVLAQRVADSVTLVTALNPIIGYKKATRIVKHAIASGCTITEAAIALELTSPAEIAALLVPERLTQPVQLASVD